MPELPELEVVQEVLNRRILGQTITAADAIPPGAAIVIRDLTGAGFSAALAMIFARVRRSFGLRCPTSQSEPPSQGIVGQFLA
jgi:hypothetical protein